MSAAPPPRHVLWSRSLPWLIGLLALLGIASLSLGSGDISVRDTFDVLMGDTANERAYFVVTELRWPRTLLAIIVGIALGVAGSVLQSSTRNPLAEPGLLGVSAGASFAIVLAINLGADSVTVHMLTAIAGALIGCSLVLAVTQIRDVGTDPVRLVLAGAAFTGILYSLSSLILLQDQRTADEIRFWVIGGLSGRPAHIIEAAIVGTTLGLLMLAPVIRPLAALALGESVATGLGHRPRLVRAWALLAVALLVGTATAAAGPIIFVGLVVPFVARRLAGPDIRHSLILCVLIGPAILLFSDIVSRLVVRPYELPVGVITALVGAPVLVAIVRGRQLHTLG